MSVAEEIFIRCITGNSSGEVTAQNVSLYHISPFTIYCEKFAPQEEKDPLSPYRELLQEMGREHERRVIEHMFPGSYTIPYESPREGFRAFLNEMIRGTDTLYNVPIIYLPENLQGRIDILKKSFDHPSFLGDHHYVIIEIKAVKKIRKEHILQGAFYTYLLSKVQGYLPPKFTIINHDNKKEEFLYTEYEEDLLEAIHGTQAILNGTYVPTATYNGAKWPWERFANHQAIKNRDVSLIGHVGVKTKEKLVERGYTRIWHVAYADVDELSQIPGIGKNTAARFISSAKAILQREPLPLDLTLLSFPTKTTELYLDLESTIQPDGEDIVEPVDYLIGVLIHEGGGDTFIPFFAEKVSDEETNFREFIAFLKTKNDYIIYHWHNYERHHIKRLAQKYGLTTEVDTLVFPFMCDLHRIATHAFSFPTYTNGLKDIASFLGFSWRHKDINALDAIAYYLKYQTNPECYRDKILAVIEYNEDDCRATQLIKKWLHSRSFLER